MLLSERELLELVGASQPTQAEPTTADVGAFVMRLDDFEATVAYYEAAELFRGEVINARSALHFSGGTADELRAAFQEAIDSYRAGARAH